MKFKREERKVLWDKKMQEGISPKDARAQIKRDEKFNEDLKKDKKKKEKVKKQTQSDSKQRFKKGIERLRGLKNYGKSKQ